MLEELENSKKEPLQHPESECPLGSTNTVKHLLFSQHFTYLRFFSFGTRLQLKLNYELFKCVAMAFYDLVGKQVQYQTLYGKSSLCKISSPDLLAPARTWALENYLSVLLGTSIDLSATSFDVSLSLAWITPRPSSTSPAHARDSEDKTCVKQIALRAKGRACSNDLPKCHFPSQVRECQSHGKKS